MSSIFPNHQVFNAAIIDLDGTMVDTMGDFVVAINLMLLDLGFDPVDRAVVATRVGKGSENLVRSVLNHAARQLIRAQVATENIANLERALGFYQQHYRSINGQHAQVYPGVVDGLQALQQAGLKLACLTNKPVGFARELLTLKGLDGFFSLVFGGDSFERKKPDALPVLKTCEALGTLPAQTLMVGDSSNDAQAARAAGCPVVLVTYGYNHGVPIRHVDADGYVDTLEAILGACQKGSALPA
ncbi:MAG: phosphoglycolate phosphatase [Polaromonas sp.]|nr:phosphoglycolate phosphatase [Polaromonas sp.]